MVMQESVHPEDAFIAFVLDSLAYSGRWSRPLDEIATAAAQGVLDALEVDEGGLTHPEVDAVVGRSITLSMQRRLSRSQRAQLVRSLSAALRRTGHAFEFAGVVSVVARAA
jgi:hypothetical protein